MNEILLFVCAAIAAFALFFGTKAAAAKFGPANEAVARKEFDRMRDFHPAAMNTYLGSAIGYDPVRNRVAIWEKRGGARLVDPNGVGAWHAGMLLTVVLNRTTTTPMIQLYAREGDTKPFFKVGVLKETDAAAWRDRLQAAFGIEKERAFDARVAGLG